MTEKTTHKHEPDLELMGKIIPVFEKVTEGLEINSSDLIQCYCLIIGRILAKYPAANSDEDMKDLIWDSIFNAREIQKKFNPIENSIDEVFSKIEKLLTTN